MGDATPWADAADLYRDLELPAGVDGRPYVAMNMVSTADGKAVVAGRAAGIGSPVDRLMMSRIRAAVDCVLIGAGTVRAEPVALRVRPDEEAARLARGWTPQPLAALVTNTGDLPLRRGLFGREGPRPVVFTSERALSLHADRFAALRDVASVVAVGAESVDPGRLLAALHERLAVRRLLVEGGPTLNQAFFSAGLVDELFLTIAPRVVGGRSRTIVEDRGEPRLDLASLGLISVAQASGELYLRYRVLSRADRPA